MSNNTTSDLAGVHICLHPLHFGFFFFFAGSGLRKGGTFEDSEVFVQGLWNDSC